MMANNDRVNESFEGLVEGLKDLRPSTEKENGKTVFCYRYNHGTKEQADAVEHPVLLLAGEMEDIHWVDIYIGLIQLRADRLEWATALQQMNREICIGQAIPRWMALHDLVGVAFVHRLDWQHVSARVMDGYIMKVLEEVHNFNNTTKKKKKKVSFHVDDEVPAGVGNQSFGQLLKDMRSLRPLDPDCCAGEDEDDNDSPNLFDYDGGVAELMAGQQGDIHWMDIVIRLRGFTIDRLDWAKILLKSNGDMCSATPIPTWWALDDQKRLLLFNRLDWRYVPANVLDDHIQRSIEQMGPAIVAEGIGAVGSGRHDPSRDKEKDYRRDLY